MNNLKVLIASREIHKFGCVYSILNTVNNRRYIGSTSNLYNRLKSHRSSLKNGSNRNKSLQKDYDLYGQKVIEVEVLKVSNDHELYEFEMIKEASKCMHLYNSIIYKKH